MHSPDSRYAIVSRRRVLQKAAGVGAVALLPGFIAACGNNDEAILTSGTDPVSSTTEPPPTTTSETTGDQTTTDPPTAESTVTETSTDPTSQTDTEAPADAGLPTGSELVVAFTYSPLPGGKDLPPYVAVWVEDVDGNLIDTIALWYLQGRKGQRWLPDLRRWFTTDQSRIEAGGDDLVDVLSSATRLPGSYSVVWDGTDADGNTVAAGEYFIAIESARERGPYSLILEPLRLSGETFEAALPDQDELVAASVAVA